MYRCQTNACYYRYASDVFELIRNGIVVEPPVKTHTIANDLCDCVCDSLNEPFNVENGEECWWCLVILNLPLLPLLLLVSLRTWQMHNLYFDHSDHAIPYILLLIHDRRRVVEHPVHCISYSTFQQIIFYLQKQSELNEISNLSCIKQNHIFKNLIRMWHVWIHIERKPDETKPIAF